MNDAGSEAKPETIPSALLMTDSLRCLELMSACQEALAEADRAGVIERIWNKDAALWSPEESHQKIIRNSLGWLTVANAMLAVAGELRFC